MNILKKSLGTLAIVYAVSFYLGALLHTGLAIGPVTEPVVLPAIVVETVCGTALLVGAYGALASRPWAWTGLRVGHAVALGGVLLGIVAIAFGGGQSTPLNDWYHRIIATLLVLSLGGALYASRVRR
ncbi:hypothetical protein [Nonomuraea africana]|uniref:DUF4383 domain-containing protein n=1 Tax=Nonomuraea africana TaxID=46171 RepID=A0ABR9K7A4_9ACTN|nr:hypothetical protein [Nonomuraea africana]MBE1557881.1 hypothetical protein [Nonomuraea africana]